MSAWIQGAFLLSKDVAAFKNQNDRKSKDIRFTGAKGSLGPEFENWLFYSPGESHFKHSMPRSFCSTLLKWGQTEWSLRFLWFLISMIKNHHKSMRTGLASGAYMELWFCFVLKRADKHLWNSSKSMTDSSLGDMRSQSRCVKSHCSAHTPRV